MDFEGFRRQVERELGTTVSLKTQRRGLGSLPPVLRDFYALTDGLELPFIEIYPVGRVKRDGSDAWGDGWFSFAFDGRSGHYLAAADPLHSPPIAFFDLDGNAAIEPAWDSVLELLMTEYDDYVDTNLYSASIRVTSIPLAVGLAHVAVALKMASPTQTSAILLRKLGKLPFTLSGVNAATAIQVVRKLHAKGVDAHVRNLREDY